MHDKVIIDRPLLHPLQPQVGTAILRHNNVTNCNIDGNLKGDTKKRSSPKIE